jgi:hypothetical protein
LTIFAHQFKNMLSKSEQATLRSQLFRHLDGIATGPAAFALKDRGVLDFILQNGKTELSLLTDKFKANEGYLNVALRIMTSQGWIDRAIDNHSDIITYTPNALSEAAFELAELYRGPVELMKYSEAFHPRKFEQEPFDKLRILFDRFSEHMGIRLSDDSLTRSIQQQVLNHIEGLLIGPTIVHLGMGGMFHKYFMQASFRADEYHEDANRFGSLLDFFAHIGWFEKKNDTYRFTDKGLFFAKRAAAYGVTVSYIPTFRHVDELIFGNADILRAKEGETEKHVDREMNVWGSGGAHATYFDRVDDIIIELFNRPISEQPSGVLDMGCGNGAFLEHIFEVIEKRTLRGKMLDEYPLLLVGADYNKAALNVTRANLIKADIWAKVVWGDISRPDLLAENLKDDYGIELKNLLNVRTFLDHNRIWAAPGERTNRVSTSTGAFASRGRRLNNSEVEDNLREHLLAWAPYIKRYGLLMIELHTIAPELTAANLGKTAATAYDATHGFSDQYIVEADVFYRVAGEAGLSPDPRLFAKFPDSDLATVTVSLLRG